MLRLAWCFLCLLPATAYVVSEGKTVRELKRQVIAEKARLQVAQENAWAGEKARLEQQLREVQVELERKLQDKDWLSGARAARQREEEWKQRLQHAPRFAQTGTERRLVEMGRLARSESMKAEQALEKAALLAAPPGSKVEVRPANGKYDVRVAFHLSALSEPGTGGFGVQSNADGLRTELHRRAAQFIKDLHATCGGRGLGRITISCNHEVVHSFVPKHADPLELELFKRRARPVMSSVYRLSLGPEALASESQWPHLPAWKVLPLLKVEKDGLMHLRLSRELQRAHPAEPNARFEF